MGTGRRRKNAEESKGDAYEPLPGEISASGDEPPAVGPAVQEMIEGTTTGPKKSSWEPRPTITVPLDAEASQKGKDFTQGEVARYIDGYHAGVDISFTHPDPTYRPSAHVLEPIKEDHENRNTPRYKKKVWHKETRNNPVAERLDGESRFTESVKRRKGEIDGQGR